MMHKHLDRWLLLLAALLGPALPAMAAEPQAPAEPKTAAQYIARALRRVDMWEWPEALADANAALRLEPKSARAMLARGAANVGINPATALRDLAAAEKLGETSVRLYCEQGLAYCALLRCDKALEAADRALKVDPKEPRAYGLRGQALARQKGLNAALEDLGKAIALNPDSAYGYGLRGEVMADWDINLGPPPADFIRLKQMNPSFAEANVSAALGMPDLRRAVQQDPDNPRYYCDRANAYECEGNFQKSLDDLDRALMLNPSFVLAYFRRMEIRALIGDYKAADADAVRMIELDPSGYMGHHAHGWYLHMTGQWAESLKELDLAIQADPRHAVKDYVARATIRLAQHNYSEVVADASKAIEINPRQIDSHYLRASAFVNLLEMKKAVADFDFLVRTSPLVADYWSYRAQAKMDMLDSKGAVEDYTQALKVLPHYPPASLARGACRMDFNDFEGAISDLRDALEHGVERHRFYGDAPGDAVAHRVLGKIFYKLGRDREALAEFDHALAIYPNDAYSLIDRGLVKRRLNDYRGAAVDFTRATTINPRDYRGYSEQGVCRCLLRDHAGAMAAFSEAMQVCRPASSAYSGRGILKLDLDDYEGGLVDLNVAVRQAYREPGAAPDGRPRSDELEEMAAGDADNPFDYLLGDDRGVDASHEGKPDSRRLAEIHQNRARAYYELAQFARAAKECDQAFRFWPATEAGLMVRSHSRGRLGDLPGMLVDAQQALEINPKCEWARYDRAMCVSLDGNFADALADLNQYIQDSPGDGAARLYRGALLYALHEGKLALADYEVALKDLRGNPPWNADQAALSIWTIRSMQARRSETDQDLRKHFKGRKPDLQRDWYGRVAAFLLEPADTEAALRREAESADGQRAPWRQTAALYYMAVRRRLAGDKSGSMELIEKAAAAHAVHELQWYESELRVRLASGKISASQGSKAAAWRDNLPQPPKSRL